MDDQAQALEALSLARTALSDPSGLSVEEWSNARQFADRLDGRMVDQEALRGYAIDKIDSAMNLLGANEDEPKLVLRVARDGVFVSDRDYDPEEEAIDVVGLALQLKQETPAAAVTIVVGRVGP